MTDEDHPDPADEDPVDEDPADEDFVLDLVREPEEPSQVPDSIRAMRAMRVEVLMPTGTPSVQEVLLNPVGSSVEGQPSAETVQRLMRAQLRLAVGLFAWFFGLVVAINVAFHFGPALAATTVANIPMEWLFPGVIFIPLLVFLGWFYVRRATANEQAVEHELEQRKEVHQ